VLIANGDADVMVPTPNSIALFKALPMRSSASSRMQAMAASSSTPTPSSIRRSAFSQNSDALREPDPASCGIEYLLTGEIRADPLPPGKP